MENKDLFRNILSSQGTYDSRAHIAEIIALLGPPPKVLVEREKRWSEVKWSQPFLNSEGTPCHTAREYFNGPFFSPEGTYLCYIFPPKDKNLTPTSFYKAISYITTSSRAI
jgi:hypothetical protein